MASKDGIRAAPPVLRVLYTTHPALTRWAKVCRAYGARRNANFAFSSQRLRAGLTYAAPPALNKVPAHYALDLSAHSAASRKRAPEARHPLAQPVRAGLKSKKIMSTVGAAPNQKHISGQTRFHVSSTTQQTPHQNPFFRDALPDSVCTESRREPPTR